MNAVASYNEAVRKNFANPAHAGDLQDRYELTLAADVSESDRGARITLAAGIRDGILAGMAFRVWGCPHLIAALEFVCTTLAEQPVAGLENFDLSSSLTPLGSQGSFRLFQLLTSNPPAHSAAPTYSG